MGVEPFQADHVARLLIATLLLYRDQRRFFVHEFAVMPNHLHMLLTTRDSITIERAVQLIKGGFSFRVKRELGITAEIWQRGYVDHRVRDSCDYAQNRAYIHANRVRAKLVMEPRGFAYSSACGEFALDSPPQCLKPLT
jgi:putative transposase